MLVDRNQIASALSLFFEPDGVFEIRALGLANDPDSRHFHSGRLIGFGVGAHISACAGMIAQLAKKATAVYLTPQQLLPEVLNRAKCHFAPLVYKDDGKAVVQATEDVDVSARRYLLIDIDSTRPADTSATESERAAAWEIVAPLKAFFASHRWPEPLVVDSGNGFHLYYRLSQPEPGGRVADRTADPIGRLLLSLKEKFDTPGASIDKSVFNSSRVMRLPGTWSRKGTETSDRPHRLCHVIEQPADWAPGLYIPPTGVEKQNSIIDLLASLPEPVEAERRLARRSSAASSPSADTAFPPLEQRIKRARGYASSDKTPPSIDGKNGSAALMSVARVVLDGFALDEDQAFGVLWSDFNHRCQGPWSEHELNHAIDSVVKYPCEKGRGWVFEKDRTEVPSMLSQLDPGTAGQLFGSSPATQPNNIPPSDAPTEEFLNEADDDPHRLARLILTGYQNKGRRTLAFFNDQFGEWSGSRYRFPLSSVFRGRVNAIVRREFESVQRTKIKHHKSDDGELPRMNKVTEGLVSNVLAALQGQCVVDVDDPPAWINGATGPDPRELVATLKGLVHLPAYAEGRNDAVIPNTPEFFTFNALAFPVNKDAPEPSHWLNFLNELWPDDPQSIALLQEWFGYLLVPDTRQQKMLLMVGPKRSGKGTIARVLKDLGGVDNCASPTLGSLGTPFGLAPLLGKTLAVIEDARLSDRADVLR